MNKLIILISILFLSFGAKENSITNSKIEVHTENSSLNSALSLNKNILYKKGTLNGNTKISLYLKEQERPCGGSMTMLNSMFSIYFLRPPNYYQWIL